MRSRKAGKRLDKVEALLSNVIEQYATNQPQMLKLLDSAKSSVVRAKAALSHAVSENGKQSSVKDNPSKGQSLAKGSKKTPLAGKEPSTAMKRKGTAADVSPAARKTA